MLSNLLYIKLNQLELWIAAQASIYVLVLDAGGGAYQEILTDYTRACDRNI